MPVYALPVHRADPANSVLLLEAWRYPCYSITDLQLYEAVAPPPFVAVADNAITHSDKGEVNSLVAGAAFNLYEL